MKLNNYLYLGKTDVSHIQNQLQNLDNNIWDLNQIRQNIYEVHKHTKSIDLMWSLESLSNPHYKNKKNKEYLLFDMNNFLQEIKSFYINQYGKGKFVRIVLTKLKAKQNIELHQDGGNAGKCLENCFRTHIPIITNPDVYFIVDGESKNMKVGEIWQIDNRKPHMVMNKSDFDRVHLIIDFDTTNSIYFNYS
jgi:hypothetical protein